MSSAAATVPTPAQMTGPLTPRDRSASLGGGGRIAASCAAEIGGSPGVASPPYWDRYPEPPRTAGPSPSPADA
jgi:hypothetical protein